MEQEKQFETEFKDLKKYDKSGNRVAIFAKVMEKDGLNYLRYFVVKANKEDNFSKEIARKAYAAWVEGMPTVDIDVETTKFIGKERTPKVTSTHYTFHPSVFEVLIEDKLHPKQTFMAFNVDAFFRKITFIMGQDYLVNKNKGQAHIYGKPYDISNRLTFTIQENEQESEVVEPVL